VPTLATSPIPTVICGDRLGLHWVDPGPAWPHRSRTATKEPTWPVLTLAAGTSATVRSGKRKRKNHFLQNGLWFSSSGPQPGADREGLTNRQIGERMFLAEKTVKNYVSALFAELGMQRRTQAAGYAARVFGDDYGTGDGGYHVSSAAPAIRA
jgi:Bacterial regulatory proteins, luxR family